MLPCTQTVEGDLTIRVGDVDLVLVDLTPIPMFAVFLPEQRVLYAADTVAVQALLPAGGVSVFTPDDLAALDRIESLDFKAFVPSSGSKPISRPTKRVRLTSERSRTTDGSRVGTPVSSRSGQGMVSPATDVRLSR